MGAQLSAPETLALLRVFLCAAEQRAADRFHAHPSFWVCIDGRAIALQPERGRGGDLRCRGRGSLAVEVDDVAAAPPCPRHIRRGRGDGGLHLGLGTVVSHHQSNLQIGIRPSVRHHAAGRDDATETGGKNDIAGG